MFIYFCYCLIITIFYIDKRTKPSFFILLLLLLSSTAGLLYTIIHEDLPPLPLFDVLYYILNLHILLIPLLKYQDLNLCINNINYKQCKNISIILIILGAITLYSSIQNFNIVEAFISWKTLRDDYYSNFGDLYSTTVLHERIAANINHIIPYTIPLAIYFLVNKRKTISIVLIIISSSWLLNTIMRAERQGLLEYIAYFIFSFLVFKDYLSRGQKKIIFNISIIIIGLLIVLVVAITISRFENENIIDALYGYTGVQLRNACEFLRIIKGQELFGHLNFHYLINKEYISLINDYIASPFFLNTFGGIVGSFYLDFGYLTVFYTILFSMFFYYILAKSRVNNKLLHFFIYFLYYQIMFTGIFYFKHTSAPFVRITVFLFILTILIRKCKIEKTI